MTMIEKILGAIAGAFALVLALFGAKEWGRRRGKIEEAHERAAHDLEVVQEVLAEDVQIDEAVDQAKELIEVHAAEPERTAFTFDNLSAYHKRAMNKFGKN